MNVEFPIEATLVEMFENLSRIEDHAYGRRASLNKRYFTTERLRTRLS